MTDAITTKPGDKYRSLRNPKAYEALRRQGYSKESAARISNAQAKRRRKAYTLDDLARYATQANADPTITALIAAQLPDLPRLKGESIAPGITRIRGDLCNVHGRYGSCSQATGGKKPTPIRTAKPTRARKPRKAAKPKKTDEQKRQEQDERKRQRDAEREAKRQEAEQQRRAERDRLLNDSGLSNQLRDALVDAATGDVLAPVNGAELVKLGLAEQGTDGAYRLSPKGRQVVNAANRGDAGQLRDAMGEARDQVARTGQRQADRERKRQERERARQSRASAGGRGSGSGGRASPSNPAPPPQQHKPRSNRGPARPSSRPRVDAGGNAAKRRQIRERAQQQQVVQAAADERRRAAEERQKVDPALADAAKRYAAGETLADAAAMQLIRNGLAHYNRDGVLVLTAAGQWASRQKEKVHGLDTGTRRTAAQGTGAGAPVRKGLRARHDRPQSADADRQTGRVARQGAAETGRQIKAIAPSRVLDAGHTGVMVALIPDAAALQALADTDGVTEPAEQLHLTLCYLGDSTEQPLATNKARVIDAVSSWATAHGRTLKGEINGAGRFFHSEDDGTNAVYVSPDVPRLPELRQSLVEAIESAGFDYAQNHGFTPHITVAYVPEDAPTPPIRVSTPVTFDHATLAWGDEQYDVPLGVRGSSLTVLKDRAGRHRWVLFSSNAYRDRDGEIVSTKALADDCDRADNDGSYGPLRWWHVPGVDIGDCDFNAMQGRILIESGTFRDERVGAAVAAKAKDLQVSIGFIHPTDEPDADGVFHHIRRFERSLVPTGRAANPFTHVLIQEQPTMATVKERLDELVRLLGNAELAQQVVAAAETTQKALDGEGVAFKSDAAPAVYTAPDGTQGIIQDGKFVALKAVEPPPVEEKAPEMMAEEAPPEEDMGEVTLSPADLQAIGDIVTAVLQGYGGTLTSKVAELDGIVQQFGYARQKEASDQQARLDAFDGRLKTLEGEQPAATKGYRASADPATVPSADRLKDLQPTAPDGDDPWADITKRLFGPAVAGPNRA